MALGYSLLALLVWHNAVLGFAFPKLVGKMMTLLQAVEEKARNYWMAEGKEREERRIYEINLRLLI